MSVKVMTWVWALDLESYSKFVLLKLADCADDEGGNSYPSVRTVAHICGLSERTVQRILKRFTESGVIEVAANEKGGWRRSRVYRLNRAVAECLHGEKRGDTDDLRGDTQSPHSQERGDTQSPLRGDTDDAMGCQALSPHSQVRGDTDDAKGCQALSPKPSLTVQEEEAQAGARDLGATPACAVWKDHHADLCAEFGADVYEQWLKVAIPECDVDGVLTLAVPTAFYRDHLNANFKDGLQKVLGRAVVIVQRGWVSNANQSKARKERLVDEEAGRRQAAGQAE